MMVEFSGCAHDFILATRDSLVCAHGTRDFVSSRLFGLLVGQLQRIPVEGGDGDCQAIHWSLSLFFCRRCPPNRNALSLILTECALRPLFTVCGESGH